ALTPNWSASPDCQWEFITAIENGKKVIPVLLEKTSLPARISKYQYADLSDGFDEAEVEKLLNDLVTLAQTIDPSITVDMNKAIYTQKIVDRIKVDGIKNT
ncbi:MAG: TIR domain-containing protein, partial [Aliifodinibius sp.]|nr:TIR domain-containing protein [Fodinibius sp.]NIY25015.1 TIR domain-containing protein [Fodinibius sp.]